MNKRGVCRLCGVFFFALPLPAFFDKRLAYRTLPGFVAAVMTLSQAETAVLNWYILRTWRAGGSGCSGILHAAWAVGAGDFGCTSTVTALTSAGRPWAV